MVPGQIIWTRLKRASISSSTVYKKGCYSYEVSFTRLLKQGLRYTNDVSHCFSLDNRGCQQATLKNRIPKEIAELVGRWTIPVLHNQPTLR